MALTSVLGGEICNSVKTVVSQISKVHRSNNRKNNFWQAWTLKTRKHNFKNFMANHYYFIKQGSLTTKGRSQCQNKKDSLLNY
jgi:5-methylcytosine-specific restriction endonuclease McrA